MTTVKCFNKKCLNNRKGVCFATQIVLKKGRCQMEISAKDCARKNNRVKREHGALKNTGKRILR